MLFQNFQIVLLYFVSITLSGLKFKMLLIRQIVKGVLVCFKIVKLWLVTEREVKLGERL
jgi:hypothetical protein